MFFFFLSVYVEYNIPCDFESSAVCGYNVYNPTDVRATPDGYWRRRIGYYYQIPPYDHTMKNESGKVVTI